MISSLRQKQLWWSSSGRQFAKRQWHRLVLGGVLGCLGAGTVHLFWDDTRFGRTVNAKLVASSTRSTFDGLAAYKLEFKTLGLILLIAVAVWAFGSARRYFRAWWAGVSSLTVIISLAITLALLRSQGSNTRRFFIAFACISAVLLLELWRSEKSRFHPKSESAVPLLNIPGRSRDSSSNDVWQASSSDDPIQDWDQDIIGRTAVVELLADHIFVQRTPIVALQGGFGDGKSSVLNLLRKAIGGHAIVVSFSAWLPGSHETLAIDLFRDIATECKEVVYVPQLRKRSTAYARTISGSVSYLAGFKEIFPAQSQRQEIEEIRETLGRVPLPIVVLLDEVDRMQHDELIVLLKILRGASSIPNLTFVCAFSFEEVKNRLFPEQESGYDYLQKFFPVSINLAPPSPEMVGRLFQNRIKAEASRRKWFLGTDEKTFTDLLQYLWQESLFHLCSNLRKAGLLLNDVVAASRPIAGEVNTFDLIGFEAIRRFAPAVHSSIRRNGRFLTYGNDLWLKSQFATGQDDKDRADFFTHLEALISNSDEASAVRVIIELLFPKYGEQNKLISRHRYHRETNEDLAEQQKRICDSSYFSMYLRSAVPEEMYSESELGQLIAALNDASSEVSCEQLFREALNDIPRQHPKREDFLWKLGRAVEKRLNDAATERIAYPTASHAHEYAYDLMNIGEAARALNIVFIAAQKLSASPKAQEILVGAMRRATDDTFAIRLLEYTKNPDRNKILTNFKLIDVDQLRDVFMKRMRLRYGKEVDASRTSISQGDWYAFRVWSQHSEDDKETERDFWRRFIGSSRKRLAQAINFIYPKGYTWSEDPRPIIGALLPVDELRGLIQQLQIDEALDSAESDAIARFEELLGGKWFDITRSF